MNEQEFRQTYLDRSVPFLTPKGIQTLKTKTVAIAGCGGVGGIAAVTLARMGIGRFHLADPGKFDHPDMNRQVGASAKTLGKNKAVVYREMIQDINPYAKITIWEEGISKETIRPFLEGSDLLIDCLDLSVSPEVRGEMLMKAYADGIFSINAPILGFGALVFCSDPKGMSMEPYLQLLKASQQGGFPKILYDYFQGEHLDLITQWLAEKKVRVPSIAIAPMIAGSVAATEAVMVFLKDCGIPGWRPPLALPQMLVIDLSRHTQKVTDIRDFLKK